jgi:hypothetical protein
MDGSEFPDQWMISGHPLHGWVNWDADPVSGMFSVAGRPLEVPVVGLPALVFYHQIHQHHT